MKGSLCLSQSKGFLHTSTRVPPVPALHGFCAPFVLVPALSPVCGGLGGGQHATHFSMTYV